MITLELPDGTMRPTLITDIDSIRVARGGTDLPELVRLGVIVTYTDGTRDAVVGSFASVCAKIAAVAMTLDDIVGLHAELGQSIAAAAPKTRTPADVLTDPQPGDRVEWEDGEVWTVTGRDTQILHDVTPPDGGGRTYGDRMGLDIWADPMDDGNGSPFVCIPHP